MAAIVIKSFNGMRPITDPLLLGEGDAQVANNVFLSSGALRPLNGVNVLKAALRIAPETIYRFTPEGTELETQHWLEFIKDTDVMRSPVALDQHKRLYWTDAPLGGPRYAPATNVVQGSGTTPIPGGGVTYLLGVPKPSTAPTITSFGEITDVPTVSKNYLLTYVNGTTFKESTPSKTFIVRSQDGLEVKLTGLPTDNKGDSGVTHKNLYREVPDASPATTKTWRRIDGILLAETEYTDDTSDADARALPALNTTLVGAPAAPSTSPIVGASPVTSKPVRNRVYTYTIGYGTDFTESAPSPSATVDADDTQKVTISGLVNSGGGLYFRIYRADDNKPTALLVKQIPVSQTSYQDDLSLVNNLGGQIGEYAPPATAPVAAPGLVTTSSTATTAVKRLYMVTFADAAAKQSSKSPVSEIVEVIDGVTTVNLYHSDTIPTGVTKKRLYRQDIVVTSGVIVANDANWKFVAENSASATSAVDTIADSALPGGGLPAALQDIPPTPTVLPSGTSTLPPTAVPETRIYCYTYVTAYDEEGPPSPSSESATVDPSKPVVVDIPPGASADRNITKIYVYRSSTGTAKTKFMFCKELTLAGGSFTDDKKTADLETILPSESWLPPPVGLAGLRLMANGAAVGFVGNTLYFSEPNRPHAWPHTYSIDEPIVGIGVFGQTVAVLTPGFPHLFQGMDPMAMSDTKLLLPQACVAKRSIVETGDGVMYASPDGLMMIGGGGVTVVSQQIMSREIWQSYKPESMECYTYNGRVIITYDKGAGARGILMFDMTGQGAVFTTSDVNAPLAFTAGFYSPEDDTLYFAQSGAGGTFGSIVRFDRGPVLEAVWKSKKFRQPQHENFGFGLLLAKTYPLISGGFPNKVEVIADGVVKHQKLVEFPNEFRLPAGFKALDWEVQITCKSEVTEFAAATSAAELQAS